MIIDMFQIVSIYEKVLEIQMSHKTMNLYKGKKDEQSKSMFVIQLLQEIDIREWLPLHEYIYHGMIIISGFFLWDQNSEVTVLNPVSLRSRGSDFF